MTLTVMAMPYPKLLFFFLFLLHTLFTSDRIYAEVALSEDLNLEWQKEQIFPSSHRQVLDTTTSHDEMKPPNTIFPTTPISTTPITIPPESDTPFVTVPASNPVTITPTTPVPVTTYPPAPATTNAPAAGQSWCVVKSGAPESSVQAALDYACGIGGADCAQIQQSGSCFNPITLQNHASYAFNSYYQKHPSPSSCDFGGTATITNTNPSTGSCIFPSSSSSSSPSSKPQPTPAIPPPATPIPPPATSAIPPPATSSIPPPATSSTPPPQISTPTPVTTPITTPTPVTTPITTPTPSTSSSSGVSGSDTPPTVLNSTTSGTPTVFGSEVPPSVNTTTSISARLQPFLGCIFLVTSFAIHKLLQ